MTVLVSSASESSCFCAHLTERQNWMTAQTFHDGFQGHYCFRLLELMTRRCHFLVEIMRHNVHRCVVISLAAGENCLSHIAMSIHTCWKLKKRNLLMARIVHQDPRVEPRCRNWMQFCSRADTARIEELRGSRVTFLVASHPSLPLLSLYINPAPSLQFSFHLLAHFKLLFLLPCILALTLNTSSSVISPPYPSSVTVSNVLKPVV